MREKAIPDFAHILPADAQLNTIAALFRHYDSKYQNASNIVQRKYISFEIGNQYFNSCFRILFSHFTNRLGKINEPPSYNSSRFTEVITACFKFITSLLRQHGTVHLHQVLSVNLFSHCKIRNCAHTSPKIINVEAPLFQHSPIFGRFFYTNGIELCSRIILNNCEYPSQLALLSTIPDDMQNWFKGTSIMGSDVRIFP